MECSKSTYSKSKQDAIRRPHPTFATSPPPTWWQWAELPVAPVSWLTRQVRPLTAAPPRRWPSARRAGIVAYRSRGHDAIPVRWSVDRAWPAAHWRPGPPGPLASPPRKCSRVVFSEGEVPHPWWTSYSAWATDHADWIA